MAMNKNVVISNEFLKVEIKSMGAEMVSITDKNGKNRLWCGDETIWNGFAPVLWPICGGLKNDEFEYNGKKYNLTKHGFGKFSEFVCEQAEKTKAVFLLASDEKSLVNYPFSYELRIIYELCKNTVRITYSVKNLTCEQINHTDVKKYGNKP